MEEPKSHRCDFWFVIWGVAMGMWLNVLERCRCCKHWNQSEYSEYKGECHMVYGFGYEKSDRVAYVEDDGGGFARLVTEADFGCNQWEWGETLR